MGERTRVLQCRGQSPSRIRRSWTAALRDSILKMTGIPLGPMNSRIAHWFLLATAETLFPQLTEACVRSSSLSSRGPWHTLISGVTHSPARSPQCDTPQARIDRAWGELVRSIALLRGRGYRPRSPPDIWSISRSIVPILSPSCSSSIRRSVRWFVRRDGWMVRSTRNAIPPTDFGEEGSPSPGRFEGSFGLFATRSLALSLN